MVFSDPTQANTDHPQQNQTNTHASNAKPHLPQHLHEPNKQKTTQNHQQSSENNENISRKGNKNTLKI
jgi:hypothetical protein